MDIKQNIKTICQNNKLLYINSFIKEEGGSVFALDPASKQILKLSYHIGQHQDGLNVDEVHNISEEDNKKLSLIGFTLIPDQIKLNAKDELDRPARQTFLKKFSPFIVTLTDTMKQSRPRYNDFFINKHFKVISYVPEVRNKMAQLITEGQRFMILMISDKGWDKRSNEIYKKAFEKTIKSYAHREFLKSQAKLTLWIPACPGEEEPIQKWKDLITGKLGIDNSKLKKGDPTIPLFCLKINNQVTLCIANSVETAKGHIIYPEQLRKRSIAVDKGTLKGTTLKKSDVLDIICNNDNDTKKTESSQRPRLFLKKSKSFGTQI